MSFKVQLLLLIFCILLPLSYTNSQETSGRVIHKIEPGGIEYVIKRVGKKKRNKDPKISRFINNKTEVTKFKEGKIVYRVIYTVDEKGFRVSSASHLQDKSKHFFIIDGSVAFGEGLNDEETMHHLVNVRSKIYEAYELGFLGQGPQHNWLLFKQNNLPRLIPQKKGSAILITHAQDFRRLIGTLDHLIYASEFPNLVESTPGHFELRGTFKDNGSFIQKFAAKFCAPFLFCKTLMTKAYEEPNDEQVAYALRLFGSIEKMYKEQFEVEDFRILWIGGDPAQILKKYPKEKIINIPFDKIDQSHPTASGAKQIVDYLFAQKIVY